MFQVRVTWSQDYNAIHITANKFSKFVDLIPGTENWIGTTMGRGNLVSSWEGLEPSREHNLKPQPKIYQCIMEAPSGQMRKQITTYNKHRIDI